jgi:formylglycine-generating enzyme required for sulfatase activity
VLGGESVERKVEILTDDGKIPVSFNEIKNVVMQGGDNVTAVILKTNGDTMRGTLYTEEISLKLEIGLELPVIYKDKFAKIFVDQARKQAPVQFGVQLPIGCESDGVMPVAFDGETITNSIGMNLVSIKPGGFWMGSSGSEKGHDKNESPQHLVKLTKGFYMGATEVSQAQWLKVMRSRPWSGKDNVREGESYPATYVSWNDAVEFCKKLSQTEGRKYRLPTEAEWEYACRADTKTAYSFGDSDSSLGDYAWFNNNANAADEKYAHAVAQKKPNPWGLYGLHGNVWEWCGDWYDENTYPPRQVIDPNGPSSGKYRILRGGSWLTYPEHCRSAHRSRYSPVKRINLIGFRIVLDLN